MDNEISNGLLKFAYDTKLFGTVDTSIERQKKQQDQWRLYTQVSGGYWGRAIQFVEGGPSLPPPFIPFKCSGNWGPVGGQPNFRGRGPPTPLEPPLNETMRK